MNPRLKWPVMHLEDTAAFEKSANPGFSSCTLIGWDWGKVFVPILAGLSWGGGSSPLPTRPTRQILDPLGEAAGREMAGLPWGKE